MDDNPFERRLKDSAIAFLTISQGVLRLLALGDVREHSAHTDDAVSLEDRAGEAADPQNFAGLGQEPVFVGRWVSGQGSLETLDSR